MEKNIKTVFITKYALTTGIIEAEMEIKDKGYCYGKPEGWYMASSFPKQDFFMTREEALEDCKKRQLKKIESLKKQIVKLEKMKFE